MENVRKLDRSKIRCDVLMEANVNSDGRKKTYRMREINNSMSPLQQRCLLNNDRIQIRDDEIDRNQSEYDAACS